jgi:hypothetical protein
MNSATTTKKEKEMTELAFRTNDGVAVALLWNRRSNALKVTVDDSRTGDSFELEAPADCALDVFYHPYAYAASQGLDVLDLLAQKQAESGPVYA